MKIWLYSLTSVFVVSLISLAGIFTIAVNEARLKKILIFLASFAVGGLFGDFFITSNWFINIYEFVQRVIRKGCTGSHPDSPSQCRKNDIV